MPIATPLKTVALGASFALCALSSAFAAPVYDLLDLNGATAGTPYALNDKGQVAGTDMAGRQASARGFVVRRGHVKHIPPLPGDLYTMAYGINNAGQVVGSSGNVATLTQNGVTTALGPLGSSASAINATGQVAGQVWSAAAGAYHAFRYDNGRLVDLGTLGGLASSANGINDAGLIVGASDTRQPGEVHAFVHTPGQALIKDLGTLGGTYSAANAINEAGWIVGGSRFSPTSPAMHAFLYADGLMNDLGMLGSYGCSAQGINKHGLVVGHCIVNPRYSQFTGFLHDGSTMLDLNSLLAPELQALWNIRDALAINNKGQITATAVYNGQWRAVLLTPR